MSISEVVKGKARGLTATETHNTLSIVTGEIIPLSKVKYRYRGEDVFKTLNPVKTEPRGILEVVEDSEEYARKKEIALERVRENTGVRPIRRDLWEIQ